MLNHRFFDMIKSFQISQPKGFHEIFCDFLWIFTEFLMFWVRLCMEVSQGSGFSRSVWISAEIRLMWTNPNYFEDIPPAGSRIEAQAARKRRFTGSFHFSITRRWRLQPRSVRRVRDRAYVGGADCSMARGWIKNWSQQLWRDSRGQRENEDFELFR